MLNHLLLYRSLTQAQKVSNVLDRAGIPNRVVRAPKAVSKEGCSHCVRLTEENLPWVRSHLPPLNLEPRRIFAVTGDEQYEEVLF